MAESAKAKKAVSAELTDKQKRFRRLMAQGAREGAVIGLIVLCIYLAMALFTFSPSDPGWASIGHAPSVQNYAGRTGASRPRQLCDAARTPHANQTVTTLPADDLYSR